MKRDEAQRPEMNYASRDEARGNQARAMAIALPAPPTMRSMMLNARDGLMIITYQLMIRVLFLARRWNY